LWPYLKLTTLFAFLFWWSLGRKERALARFSNIANSRVLIPNISPDRHLIRFLLWRWAVAFILIALINPRYGTKEIDVASQGVDLMICVDVSNSMLASDMQPDRLSTAKRSIFTLLDELSGDRVGLIPFAGDAFVMLPLTNDYNAAGLFLNSIETDIIPTQGTAIGKAIDLATDRLNKYAKGSASIIILTDGENHEDDAIASAKAAADLGFPVHTVGLGTIQGAPIPMMEGRNSRGFKKDKEGNTVISKYNEGMLREIAAAGKGLFLAPDNGYLDLSALHEAILSMDVSDQGEQKYESYHERFQIFLLLAAILIIIETLIPLRAPLKERSKFANA
jgi:Ca-activated chloride channel family protein